MIVYCVVKWNHRRSVNCAISYLFLTMEITSQYYYAKSSSRKFLRVLSCLCKKWKSSQQSKSFELQVIFQFVTCRLVKTEIFSIRVTSDCPDKTVNTVYNSVICCHCEQTICLFLYFRDLKTTKYCNLFQSRNME